MEKPLIIGITGGSGSGKTTFIRELRSEFSDKDLCLVSQDDYYRPREKQRKDDNGIVNFDLPYSIYKKDFIRDVQKLIAGETVTREEYTYNNDNVASKMLEFHPAPVIIVEGLFIFHYKKMKPLLDLKVFIHAKENLKVIRRIKRDRVERNYPLDDVLYRYEAHVLPGFEKYIKPYMSDADLIINNNSNFNMALEVMKGFVRDRVK